MRFPPCYGPAEALWESVGAPIRHAGRSRPR